MSEETTDPRRVIYKHRVRQTMGVDTAAIVITSLTLTAHAEVLSVVSQPGGVYLYETHAVETRTTQSRDFMVIGTDHEFMIPRDRVARFIATCQTSEGYVWHVYEVKKY